MPNYEYECLKCGHTFEFFQSMSAKHLESCPKCGGKVRRLIGGGAGIIFKGPKAKPCEKADSSCPSDCKHNYK